MNWIWQLTDWPNFKYDQDAIASYESKFLLQVGAIAGIAKCLPPIESASATVDLMSDEALNTSEIEGEYLNRESLRSSIRHQLGLGKERTSVKPGEEGVAEMLVNLYQHSQSALDHETLFYWHEMLTRSRWDLNAVGSYRTHAEEMEIVSGVIGRPRVHYQAPPSAVMQQEMDEFFAWYNKTAPGGSNELPAITRSAIAHLFFVCIHPFEDGNGRLARAITVKSLSENIGEPILLSLSQAIAKNKKAYYQALARQNRNLEITPWLIYFAETILTALAQTKDILEFLIAKARFFDCYDARLNARQRLVVMRMFREGLGGFKGGLSAKNYMTIAKSTPSTTTRDLQGLIDMGAFTKTGDHKGRRYYLNIHSNTEESI